MITSALSKLRQLNHCDLAVAIALCAPQLLQRLQTGLDGEGLRKAADEQPDHLAELNSLQGPPVRIGQSRQFDQRCLQLGAVGESQSGVPITWCARAVRR